MRLLLLLAVVLAVLGAGAVPAAGQPAPPPPPPPVVVTPDTSGCPYRSAPPPATDQSEAPQPGVAAPEPLPVPEEPVGGERLGECGLVLPPDAPPPPEDITATSWIIADLDTGEVLAAKDPHGRHRPASTIKLLTALVAGERLPPEQVVEGTEADAAQEGSSAGIGPGGRYTVTDLLAGLLLQSGNDTAFALARALGGVDPALAAMNAKARSLGALDTRATSVSGLDAAGMSTSAYDLALVMRGVLARPGFAQLLRTPQVPFPGFGDRPGFVLSNDNRLLVEYPGALGGKTGFTNASRHTYVGAAERDGRRLVVVLLRAEQQPVRTTEQAARLLDYGFALPPGQPVGRLVDGRPPPPGAVPATTGAPAPAVAAAPGVADVPPGMPDRPAATGPAPDPEPGGAAAWGWLLAAAGVVVGLIALLQRQRHRARD